MYHSPHDKKNYIPLIVEKLKKIKPYRVILFGSYASGFPDPDSDIDLLIVTADDYMPHNYKEKSNIYLHVSRALRDVSTKVPVDLIVYTKPMYEKFNELGSLFSKEIMQRGVVLYEADNA